MTSLLGLLWLLWVLAFGAWLLASALCAVLIRGVDLPALSPLVRRRRAWLTAVLPLVLPAAVVAAAGLLAGAKAVGWINDHCIHHGGDHPHFCFAHLPALDFTSPSSVLVALFTLFFCLVLLRGLQREQKAAATTTSLKNFASGKGVLRILHESRPWAFASGIWRPFVLVSDGLRQHLNTREWRLLVGHEIAHLRHGDPLRLFLFEILLLLHIPSTARRLRQAMHQAVEELADDKVAQRFGPEPLAELLLKIARLSHSGPTRVLAASGADPLCRARRLLFPTCAQTSDFFEWGYASLLVAVFALVLATHHPFETLLGYLW